jgi:hypothetical protein
MSVLVFAIWDFLRETCTKLPTNYKSVKEACCNAKRILKPYLEKCAFPKAFKTRLTKALVTMVSFMTNIKLKAITIFWHILKQCSSFSKRFVYTY